MQYKTLGRSELKVSAIGLGCVTFGREIDAASSYPIMDHVLACGINLFDTAEAYAEGASESVVGNWLQRSGKRDQIVLATKVSPPLGNRVIEAAEASLRRLRTDTIDLYQVHQWDPTTPLDETLASLTRLIEQGKVRAIGCSNSAAWQLCKALWVADVQGWTRMESVQPNYNLAVRDIEDELLPLCAEEEVGVITYSPLGAGFLTGKYHTAGVSPTGARFDIKPAHWNVYNTPEAMRRMEGLRTVSETTGRSMVDLALSWVFAQPGITSVLVGARTTEHIDQALRAEQSGLDADLRQALDEL